LEKTVEPEAGIESDELLRFFKVLADATRLKILGLLSRQRLSVEQLAELLNLRPSTVSHHLARLSEVGLVSARPVSYYNLYQVEFQKLEELSQRLLSREALPAAAANVDMDAYERKVLADFSLPDGRLKTIPAQRKKLEAILRHIARSFEPGVSYSEKEVNAILARFHDDTATLRRELVGHRLLARDHGIYWRVEPGGD
jgi:predicted transcriptional regulator